MDITLFSTHCPKCSVLEKKLRQKHMEFKEVNDVKKMTAKGFASAPVLEVDGICMDFAKAVTWINKQ